MFWKKLINILGNKNIKGVTEIKSEGGTDSSRQSETLGKETPEIKMETEETSRGSKDERKLFVGGLSQATTSKKLEEYFSTFGTVVDAVVMRFPESGKSKGYGFVTFANPGAAKFALCTRSHLLDGKSIDLRPFQSSKTISKSSKRESEFRVFIGGLPPNFSTDNLKDIFALVGEVTDAVIPVNKDTKKPKGFAFVEFKSEETVEKLLAMKNIFIGGRQVQIKRVNPRNRSQVQNAVEVEDVEKTDEGHPQDRCRLSDERSCSRADDSETCSVMSESEYSDVYELFQDYFAAKFQKQCNMNEGKSEGVSRDLKVFESLLADFLGVSNVESTSSTNEEDLIRFTDDSESEETTDVSDTDAIDSAVESSGSEEDGSMSGELNVKLNEILSSFMVTDDSVSNRIPEIVSGGHGGGENRDFTGAVPSFKFTGNNGSLFCSLCQWRPHDNSFEGFLTHCKTPAHKTKLRERFKKPKLESEESKNGEGVRKSSPDRVPSVVTEKNLTKKQMKREKKAGGKEEASVKIKSTRGKQAKTTEVKTENAEKVSKVKKEGQTDEKESIKSRKLKIMALVKGMSYIRSNFDNKLECTMCKKVIPQAWDLTVLMKNVTFHLQGKRHLKNVLAAADSPKTVSKQENLEKKCVQGKEGAPMTGKPSEKQKNVQGKEGAPMTGKPSEKQKNVQGKEGAPMTGKPSEKQKNVQGKNLISEQKVQKEMKAMKKK